MPIEACLQLRRSTRQFGPGQLSLADLSQVLWAGQGITGLGGLRTAPSAGALYPVRTYVVAARVRGLPVGLYRFDADDHYIRFLKAGDPRDELVEGGLDISAQGAAVLIVLAADSRRVVREYGEQAQRLVCIEAGHIGQNICLEATALGLGVIGLGAMNPETIRVILGIREHEEPVYLLALGKRAGTEPLI